MQHLGSRNWRVCALFSIAAFGCASAPKAPPAPIQARVSGVFPKTKDLSTSVLSVKVELYNPRPTPIGVGEIKYRVDTQEVAGVIEGSVVAGATLPAEQQAEVGFEVEVPLPSEVSARLALLAKASVPADLQGEVQFNDGTSTPFERKAGLAMPSMPEFLVFDAQAAQYEKKGIDVTMFLRLLNNNGFTQSVQGVTYTISLGEQALRTGEAGVGARLLPGGAEEYEESMTLTPDSFAGLPDILRSGVIRYRVSGEVRTRELMVPFEHDGVIDLGGSE